ncbi:MAG: hypothetical protein ABEN55_09200 [Bradymonadaceae bacterium]
MDCRHRLAETTRAHGWRTAMLAMAAAAVVVATTGCGGEQPPADDGDSGWYLNDTGSDDVSPDTGTDAGPDTGTDTGPDREAEPVEFELINKTDGPIQIQPRSGCTSTGSEWMTLHRGGDQFQASRNCGTCSCEDAKKGQCAICRCAPTRMRSLAAGESVTWTWRGYAYRGDTVNGQSCTRRTVPGPGTYEAEFCWKMPDVTLDGESSKTCKKVSFEYGTDETIRHAVKADSAKKPRETTFRIHNDSDRSVAVKPPTDCGSGKDAWVRLRDGAGRVKLSSWCGDCQCSNVSESGACGRCGAACSPTPLRHLAPGDSAEFVWSGRAYRRERKNGTACWRERVPSVGQQFKAEFCWKARGPADGWVEKCRRHKMDYGEDRTVEHTISSSRVSPTATTFKLVNNSNDTIRYQKNARCSKPAWLDFADDAVKATENTCGLCECEEIEENGSCPPCAAGACRSSQIGAIEPGQSVEWTWQGYAYRRDVVDEKTCQRKIVPSAGRSFKVRVCWKETDGPTGEGTLQNPNCTDKYLAYGKDVEVVTRVQ